MKLEAWSASNIGLVRQSNQDAVGCFPELQLAIVADGMGGRTAGEVASRLAVEVIHDMLRAARQPRRWWHSVFARRTATARNDGDQLRAAIELANRRIFEAGRQQSTEGASMGTTVVVLLFALDGGTACWAHVGDSRLYRLREQELALLTADHTRYGEAYWNEHRIPVDLPHTNVLVRALGIDENVTVSTGNDTVRVGDVFLLCSDGVSGFVSAEVIRNTLRVPDGLAAAGDMLIHRALEAGGRDNASLVLVRIVAG
jgi:protein phosphatase